MLDCSHCMTGQLEERCFVPDIGIYYTRLDWRLSMTLSSYTIPLCLRGKNKASGSVSMP